MTRLELDPWLEGVDLLILDNLSSLTTALREIQGLGDARGDGGTFQRDRRAPDGAQRARRARDHA